MTNNNNKPIADILKLKIKTETNEIIAKNENKNKNKNNILSKLIFLYQFVSIQFIGIISYLILNNNNINSDKYILFGSILLFIGSEFNIRGLKKLQLLYNPNWILYNPKIQNLKNIKNVKNIKKCLPSFIEHLHETESSRKIFTFLVINFLFMFVEFIYGYLSNSLGLISDACHMLFDCIALLIGLIASYLGSNYSNKEIINKYSYGYGKVKVLSGFINAIFLIYIGLSVLIESFERIIHPPHIHTDQLLIVSVLGLFVNLIGLFFFHDAHLNSHSHSHSHSHECNHTHNDHNIRGIFLHILADTLGSVGVIISSLLIYFFDLVIFDTLCSVFIAILIFMTVYPLIKSTSKILLQETPNYILLSLKNNLSNVLSSVSGIIGYREAHFWEYEPGKLVGTIHIQIHEHSNEQQLLSQINHILMQRFPFKSEKDLTIQIEKQSYLDKCDPIHHSVYSQIIPIDHSNHDHGHTHHNHNHNHNHNHKHDELHSNCGSDNSNSSFIKVGLSKTTKRYFNESTKI